MATSKEEGPPAPDLKQAESDGWGETMASWRAPGSDGRGASSVIYMREVDLVNRLRSTRESPGLTVFVCTRNSEATLEKCLLSISRSEPHVKIVVIDQSSVDRTVEIARRLGAEVISHNIGLGYARQLGFDMCKTEHLAFVDSDEEIIQPRFFDVAIGILEDPTAGAVVGMSAGHRFAYGLPMGLLVLRAKDFQGRIIPSSINAREEFYVRRRLRSMGLSVVFVSGAMIHRSQYRRYKPEWEGANTRVVAGFDVGQLVFTAQVVLLQSLNSRSPKNLAYTPLFYLKFLRGFIQPWKWRILRQTNE